MTFQRMTTARVWIAVGLVLLCAFSNIRYFQRCVKQYCISPEGGLHQQYLSRYEPLLTSLPERDRLGFLSQSSPDCPPLIALNRLQLARYAVVPCLLEDGHGCELVIFDSDDAHAVPEHAIRENWELVANAGNGLKLYRTSGAK